eukprot:9393871-Lingulodinium_polyedra.AAC.1
MPPAAPKHNPSNTQASGHKPIARTFHAQTSFGVCMECARRAVVAAGGRFDRIIAHGFKTVHNDAIESTVCRHSGFA